MYSALPRTGAMIATVGEVAVTRFQGWFSHAQVLLRSAVRRRRPHRRQRHGLQVRFPWL